MKYWLGIFLIFTACTDYVGQIDDDIDALKAFEKTRNESMIPLSEVGVEPSSVFEGVLKDSRDGKSYRTVTIGMLTWMAENLNYETSGSYCYNDDSDYCDKYGRLYTWATAMDSASESNGAGCGYGKMCTPTYPVKGVCPDGWHLPSFGEWETLKFAVCGCEVDGQNLKSKRDWEANGGGKDLYAFSAVPAGVKSVNGKYFYEGSQTYFWSSTDYGFEIARAVNLDYGISLNVYESSSRKMYAYSVRCVKDDRDEKPTEKPEIPVSYVDPCKTDSTDNCKYGTLMDSRDGHTYRTVTVGSQTWMAENLKFETADSYCFDNVDSNCVAYGRLYTWGAAMDSAGVFSQNSLDCGSDWICRVIYPVRGICPEKWHLPTQKEWQTLAAAVGGVDIAGKMLKSTSGWSGEKEYGEWKMNLNGVDAYGFSALPAGDMEHGSMSNDNKGRITSFWSSTEVRGDGGYGAYYVSLSNIGTGMGISENPKYSVSSIRCVKDVVDKVSEENIPHIGEKPKSSSSAKSNNSTKSSSSLKLSSSAKSSNSAKSSSSAKSSNSVKSSSSKEHNSSGIINSSHSNTPESSSSPVAPCRNEKSDTCEYGTLTDDRDGKTYKTVVIGTQIWMAENLNYEVENSCCYNNSTEYCDKYGRLYTWAAAMDSAGLWSDAGKGCGYGTSCSPAYPVRGVCPSGWHLPSNSEYNALLYSVGDARESLKTTSGWGKNTTLPFINGSDAYGFSALPAGGKYGEYGFGGEGETSIFWSSDEYLEFGTTMEVDQGFTYYKERYDNLSVRCIKN